MSDHSQGRLMPPRLYDGDGDLLMSRVSGDASDRILLLPDRHPGSGSTEARSCVGRNAAVRVMWGQDLLEDLVAGRYRSLVCAVNAVNNGRGIIARLAELLPTSQWDEASITTYARQFATGSARAKVLKYDMDRVEVLGILRPPDRPHLTLADLSSAYAIVSEIVDRGPHRWPSASVCFLGARANRVVGRDQVSEPTFESVLRAMHAGGYRGDVYPSPTMWQRGHVGVFSRYPYPPVLDVIRNGGC